MSTLSLAIDQLAGTDLGEHVVTYDETAIILYALSVGAEYDDLSLVYERDLRALPTYACALGLWAVEAAGRLGAYDPKFSLHASQRLIVHKALPVAGSVTMSGSVKNVFDKGKATILEIEVTSRYFTATYNIFLPGVGGWGGERGPSSTKPAPFESTNSSTYRTAENQAALYRLTGDRHPIHIDPEVASANGFERPIFHGLGTLGIAILQLAKQIEVHPSDLIELDVRLSAPVVPGQEITVSSMTNEDKMTFQATAEGAVVLSGGTAAFSG